MVQSRDCEARAEGDDLHSHFHLRDCHPSFVLLSNLIVLVTPWLRLTALSSLKRLDLEEQ